MKGHNAFSPCRACDIEGVLFHYEKVSVYYFPLVHPAGNVRKRWDCTNLPMRSHHGFITRVAEINAARTKTERKAIAQYYGINSLSIFAALKSIDLASSFPYDIMHLFFENLVPNLILHWTGGFKGLDVGSGNYQLSAAQWKEIGKETASATKTIPSAFVGTLPDIAQDRNLYKAEAYSFWIQFLAPALLEGRLQEKYYKYVSTFSPYPNI
jgi:hypothetical protein